MFWGLFFYCINITTLFFWLMFPWYICSTLAVSTCLNQCIWSKFFFLATIELCFWNHSANLCPLIDVFRSFAFKIIAGILVLESIILLFVFCSFVRFSGSCFVSLFLSSCGSLWHILEFHPDLLTVSLKVSPCIVSSLHLYSLPWVCSLFAN